MYSDAFFKKGWEKSKFAVDTVLTTNGSACVVCEEINKKKRCTVVVSKTYECQGTEVRHFFVVVVESVESKLDATTTAICALGTVATITTMAVSGVGLIPCVCVALGALVKWGADYAVSKYDTSSIKAIDEVKKIAAVTNQGFVIFELKDDDNRVEELN
jgi:hypothetical protein